MLLAHLYIKTNEIVGKSDIKPVPSVASHIYITLGGRSENGDSMENELSYLFLEAAPLVKMRKPEINIRIDSQSPAEFKLAVATAMKTCAQQIQLWNESQILNAFETFFPKISKEDACNYSFTACNRIDLPGFMSVFITGGENWHVLPTWLLAALNDGQAVEDSYTGLFESGHNHSKVQPVEGIIPLDQISSMEDILSNFRLLAEVGVAHAHKNTLAGKAGGPFPGKYPGATEEHQIKLEPLEIFHFDSVLMHDSLEKCLDISQGGMRYPTNIHLCYGNGHRCRFSDGNQSAGL